MDIITFINGERMNGTSDVEITRKLVDMGCSEESISEAYSHLTKGENKSIRDKQIKRAMVFSLFIILLLSIITYLVYENFYLTPTRVSMAMIQKMKNLETVAYQGNVTVEFEEGSSLGTLETIPSEGYGNIVGQLFENIYTFNFKGRSSINDQSNFDFTGNIQFMMSILPIGNLDYILKDGKLFIKLNSLSPSSFINGEIFLKDWVWVNDDEIRKSSLIGSKYSEMWPSRINLEFIEALPLSTPVKLEDSFISGVSVYHYQSEIDKVKLKEFIKENIPEIKDEVIDKMIESVDISTIDYYVGKNDYYLYKLSLMLESNPKTTKDTKVKVSFQVNFSDYNKEVRITEPDSHVPLSDHINSFVY